MSAPYKDIARGFEPPTKKAAKRAAFYRISNVSDYQAISLDDHALRQFKLRHFYSSVNVDADLGGREHRPDPSLLQV